ncbi:hypothetical protein L3Y34_005386 [Caenorhabditis briggsae]|uniref:Uncharacterized protein n=1 Tax=Caenorhabditis briggsae TaxID=6238 RepID=A0AAE9AHJ7_CAEBR|nr:hypothetical protein L3Y34_005386 [Caenorhabditis briggsae]
MGYQKTEETGQLFQSSQENFFKFSNFRRRFHIRSLFYFISIFSLGFFVCLYITFGWQKGGGDSITVSQSLPSYSNYFNTTVTPTKTETSEKSEKSEIQNDSKYQDDCSLPVFDPWDETIKPFMVEDTKMKFCNKNFKPFTELVNGTFRVVEEKEGRTCKGRCHTLPDLTAPFKVTNWFSPGPTDCEFLEAVCWEKGQFGEKEVYGWIHTQIVPNKVPKPSIEKSEHPDVFVFVMDSLASGMAKRSLPKTLEFMKTKLQAVDFPYLSQVGTRSQVNAVPLWFGKQVEAGTMKGGKRMEADWTEEEYCKNYLDDKPNMFRDFLDAGYTTNYLDNWIDQTLTHNPICKGFQHFHTNHTFFPLTHILERTVLWVTKQSLKGTQICREVHQATLEYFDQFVRAYPDRPKFTWSWFVHLAHEKLAGPDRADPHFLEFFQNNFEIFDDAFVIFTADHGFRAGSFEFYKTKIGAFEKHNPFLQISVPKKYRDNGILEVMRENANRLQSHYDTRATILDILKYQPSSQFTDHATLKIPDEKGNSLLRQQPLTPRNCEHLPIPQQYCICQSKSTDLTADAKLCERLGRSFLAHINSEIDNFKLGSLCHKFDIQIVLELDLHASSHASKTTYHISVKTQHPAQFETLITEDKETKKLTFDQIERLDRYGSTADCSKPVHFTNLCFCKTR